jgi:hypothetical protein
MRLVAAAGASMLALALLANCAGTHVGNPKDTFGDGGIDDEDDGGLGVAEEALIDDGHESNEAGETAGSLLSLTVATVTDSAQLGSDDASATAAVGVKDKLRPKTCTTANRNGSEVDFTFDDCIGPFGISPLAGELIAKYHVAAPGELTVDVTSNNLSANGVAVSINATVTLTIGPKGRTTEWDGTFTGTTLSGKPVTHHAHCTLSFDSPTMCLTYSGTADSTVGQRELTTSVTNFELCNSREACPKTGVIVYSDSKTRTSDTVTFSGGQEAQVTNARGRTYLTTLKCDPRL